MVVAPEVAVKHPNGRELDKHAAALVGMVAGFVLRAAELGEAPVDLLGVRAAELVDAGVAAWPVGEAAACQTPRDQRRWPCWQGWGGVGQTVSAG